MILLTSIKNGLTENTVSQHRERRVIIIREDIIPQVQGLLNQKVNVDKPLFSTDEWEIAQSDKPSMLVNTDKRNGQTYFYDAVANEFLDHTKTKINGTPADELNMPKNVVDWYTKNYSYNSISLSDEEDCGNGYVWCPNSESDGVMVGPDGRIVSPDNWLCSIG